MINRDYLYTRCYSIGEPVTLKENSTYFYGYSLEERSHWVDMLKKSTKDKAIQFVGISMFTSDSDTITENITDRIYQLRSASQMEALIRPYLSETIYIDISGFNSRICASLLKNILQLVNIKDIDINIIYAEPDQYDVKAFKKEGVFNDLSESIDGINPLPAFESIIPESDDSEVYFIPFLGFEGGRFSHILENIPPLGDNIIPVIGVAGFRIEYPFVTYWGNQRPLKQSESWDHVEYATANSLAEAFILLKQLHKKYPRSKFKIAPIGTKPHAIGAILYAITNPQNTELIYDNPKRKKTRTKGVGNVLLTSVSRLLIGC